MKLTFKIEKDTKIDYHISEDKIASQLKDLRYEIVEKGNSCVSFKDMNKRGMSFLRIDEFFKASKGTFEIIEFENRRRVKLTYLMSITEELILIPSLVLIGPFYDFYPCFGAAFFFIIFLFRIFFAKMQWKNILDEIVK